MISIFTPTNDSKFLSEIYKCLLAQTDPDWEWVILGNNGAEPLHFDDPRVKFHYAYNAPEWVGPLKAAACEHCTGEILLELDHDDLLLPTAIAEVKAAFRDPKVGFVYSNTVHALVEADGTLKPTTRFDPIYGWNYREIEIDGVKLDEHISFPPTPESVSRIWFAPNHLRAFRASLYRELGGHNKEMRILDDLDLMCRMYQVCKFYHINHPLYVYRIHGQNSWLRYNEEIQQNVYRIYDTYIEALTEKWAEREGLRKLELGGRMAAKPGFETVDLHSARVCTDLNSRWPFKTSSVGILRAYDVFEHLRNPIHTMKEAARVLAPGGWIFCQVPSTDGRGAFQDPTHCSFWCENSFLYYTEERLAKYIDTPVRFQASRLYTSQKNADGVCWVTAHLINLKGGYRPCGELRI